MSSIDSLLVDLETERVRVARALTRLETAQEQLVGAQRQQAELALQLHAEREQRTHDARLVAAAAHQHQQQRASDAAEARAVLSQWKAAFERELAARDVDAEPQASSEKEGRKEGGREERSIGTI